MIGGALAQLEDCDIHANAHDGADVHDRGTRWGQAAAQALMSSTHTRLQLASGEVLGSELVLKLVDMHYMYTQSFRDPCQAGLWFRLAGMYINMAPLLVCSCCSQVIRTWMQVP